MSKKMNEVTIDKKTAPVGMLCEGNSIRRVERMGGSRAN